MKSLWCFEMTWQGAWRAMALSGCVWLVLGGYCIAQDNDLSGADVFGGSDDEAEAEGTGLPFMPPMMTISPKAEQLYQEGKALLDNEQWGEAAAKFSDAMLEEPRFVQAFVDRATCFAKLRSYDAAIKDLSLAIRAGGAMFPEIHDQLGQAFMKVAGYRDALESFSQAIGLRPSNPEYLYRHASAMIELGLQTRDTEMLQSAVDEIDRVLDIKDDYAEAYSDRGRVQVELAEWDEALEDLEKAVQLEPTNREFIQRLGFGYLRRASQEETDNPENKAEIRGFLEKAIDALSQFLDETPEEEPDWEDPELAKPEAIYVTRAAARISLAEQMPVGEARHQQYELAIDDCDQSLDIEPKQPNAHYNRGLAYRMMEDFPAAIDAFTKALKLSPEYGEVHLRRGIVWFHMGELDLAQLDFEAAMVGTNDPRAMFWIGLVHAKRGDFEEAVLAYTQALRLSPEHALAYGNRGLAHLRLGKYERAVADFNELIQRDRTNAAAYYRRGVAYQLLGKNDAAIRSFEKAAELDPTAASYRTHLSQLRDKARTLEPQ